MLHGIRKPIDKYAGAVLSTCIRKKKYTISMENGITPEEGDSHMREKVNDEIQGV